jgi:predicted metal-dependent peptidase
MSTPQDPHHDTLQQEAKRLHTVKLTLLFGVPFWASLLMQTKVMPVTTLQTYGATDGADVIYYNPLLTRRLSLKQLTFLLLHELIHIAFCHVTRRQTRDPQRWNEAADYFANLTALDIMAPTINGSLDRLCEPIEGALLDSAFRGDAVETIYEKLADSSAVRPSSSPIDTHSPTLDDTEARDRVLDKLLKAHAHWEASGQRGTVPNDVLRRIDAIRQSVVPWQRIIRQWAAHCLGHDEYSFTPPHRRRLLRDQTCFPSLRGEQAGSLVILVDTSGSIAHDTLCHALSELPALHDLTDTLLVLSHDADVHDVIPTQQIPTFIRSLRTGTGKMHGGGGTDHRPAFEWLAHHRLVPDLLIAFTDLATVFPPSPPPYPVLWCVWPSDTNRKVPFGRVITIHPSRSAPQ